MLIEALKALAEAMERNVVIPLKKQEQRIMEMLRDKEELRSE